MGSRTHVTFVLDSSGSMSKIADDTRGGFNTFLQEQREEEGEATVTLYDFNSTVELVYRGSDIADAEKLDTDNYRPGGQTALHDAIARAVDETDDYVAGVEAADEVDNVIVVVLTDGKENASETPQETVRERVEEYREEHGWEFLFIGANQDAALTAEQMGMDRDKSLEMAHDGEGAEAAQASVSESVSRAREQGSTEGFNEEDRQAQERSED
jgi:Mg-chelatase subunit ChlD